MAHNGLRRRVDRIAESVRRPDSSAPLSIIDARPSTGKSAAEIDAEIARACEHWGTVIIIDL